MDGNSNQGDGLIIENLTEGNYSVTLTDANNCIAENTFIVETDQIAPFVRIDTAICDAEGLTYRAVVTVPNAESLEVNGGTVRTPQNGTYLITNIPGGLELEVTATYLNEPCPYNFTVPAPDCDCNSLDAPLPVSPVYTYCIGENAPVITVAVPEGISVNWYDASAEGNLIGTGENFQTTGPGFYYAESFVENTNCISDSRTPILVEEAGPKIDTIYSICNFSTGGYEVNLQVVNLTNIIVSEGDIVNNGGGSITIQNVTLGQDLELTLFGNGCEVNQTVDSPDCGCPSLDAPIPEQALFDHCQDEVFPTLVVSVPDNSIAQWYTDPEGGSPFGTGNTYQPSTVGRYYVESRIPETECVSTERSVIEVIDKTPTIDIGEPECDPQRPEYSVFVTLTNTLEFTSNVGVPLEIFPGFILVDQIPNERNLELSATSDLENCITEVELENPGCPCPQIQAPVAASINLEYCASTGFPELRVTVPEGQLVRWFDAPSEGNLLGEGNIYQPISLLSGYYAEATFENSSCASPTRTAFQLSDISPQINFVADSCNFERQSYSIDFNVSNADQVIASIGTLNNVGAGNYRLIGMSSNNQRPVITATNTFINCTSELTLTVPSCNCPEVALPIPTEELVRYCEDSTIPVISVQNQEGIVVNWFNVPFGGTAIQANSFTYQPDGPGVYFAESVDLNSGCVSERRVAIEVRQIPKPTFSLDNSVVNEFNDTYTVTLTINFANEVTHSVGDLVVNRNVYTITNVPLNQNIEINASNSSNCTNSFTVFPEFPCRQIASPNLNNTRITYCGTGTIPSVTASVEEGFQVNWYTSSIGGTLIAQNVDNFTPPGPGRFWAEASSPTLSCKSNDRTPLEVVRAQEPVIKFLDRICSEDESTYTIVLEFEMEVELRNSLLLEERREGTRIIVENIPIDESISITASSNIRGENCDINFDVSPPTCDCARPQVPSFNQGQSFEYCEGEIAPVLEVNTPEGSSANWYDRDGQLLVRRSNRFRPRGPGTYFVESVWLDSTCNPSAQIGIEVEQLNNSFSFREEFTCDIQQVGADTIRDMNSVGCDSLIITNRYIREILTKDTTVIVCDPAEVDTTTELIEIDSCSYILTTRKILENFPENAQIEEDQQIFCDSMDAYLINANLPDGAIGQWTGIPSSILVDDPEMGNTFATNLDFGVNQLIWSLSTANCTDYSRDTLIITVARNPNLGDDVYSLRKGQQLELENLLLNDTLPTEYEFRPIGGGDIQFEIMDGLYTGRFSYLAPNESEAIQFQYEICDPICLSCDTARVEIITDCQIAQTIEVPDGFNPARGEIFNPFNSLVSGACGGIVESYTVFIYNVFGQEVFNSNDPNLGWDGKNHPTGTYFWIMRYKAGDKENLLKGNVLLYNKN